MDDPDEAGGVRMVEDDASALFEGTKDMQEAFAVETTDAEAPKPYTHAEATNVEWHMSHLVMQKSSQVSSVNPDSPEPSPMPTDHSVTLPINQAPVYAMTYDMPYHKAIHIPFAATSGPIYSDSIKQISFTFLDTPDPLSIHTEANSLVKGSANANGSTTKNWHTISGHMSFIDGDTHPRLLQQQKTAPSPTTEHDHITVAHGNTEAS
jgi:hypothetical protein